MAEDRDEQKIDESPVEGGAYISGGKRDKKTGKHMGGKVIDAKGEVIARFEDNEVNTGLPRADKSTKKAGVKDE